METEVQDVYSFGFDKKLNRVFLLKRNPLIYDTINDQAQAQIVQFGSIQAGSQNTIFQVDPAKGQWMGNAAFASAPFSVDMQGNLVATSATINGSALSFEPFFGDGSDGDVTISVNTTLTADKYYSTLTIADAVTLNPGGYRIFVRNTLTRNGTGKIARNGTNGGAGGNGGDASGANKGAAGAAGAASAALASGSIFGALAGSAGGAGAGGTGAANEGVSGSAGAAGATIATGLGVVGSAGATGGNGGSGTQGAGGTGDGGGAAGTFTAAIYKPRVVSLLVIGHQINNATVGFFQSNGTHGGAEGGGSGGGNTAASSNGGGGGGGGGSGSDGAFVMLSARILALNNSNTLLQSKGGNGGAGGNGGNAAGAGNSGGGGGGAGGSAGSGGVIALVYGSLTNGSIATDVTGGTVGTGGTGGTATGTGTVGTSGASGTAGTTGLVITLQS